ncbi:8591_t:CDS:1 [Ambispora leptoticha]|uniref:8591_t:CDS:1 n=1 Tax=Ambispora leptoticha TaxID=144679 RepID=A0A9N9GXZ8_9GLOM|nr:8591_t:CDS:1 [Ambispora leptoticha]
MVKNNNHSVFPPQEEFERVVKRVQKSDKKTNIGLSPNASPMERAKYDFCQTIARYRRENNLAEKSIAQQLGITLSRLDSILYSHIDEFTLDELASYVSNLHILFELKVFSYGRKEATAEAH